MPHFFQPSAKDPAHYAAAAAGAELFDLLIRPGAVATVGLWGELSDRYPFDVWVLRQRQVISGLPSSPVKVALKAHDPRQQYQVYDIVGLRDGDVLVGVYPRNGRPATDELPVHELRATPNALMREAAQLNGAIPHRHPAICYFAIPYLGLRDPGQGAMTPLDESRVGAALGNVHGLAVHTTAGTDGRKPYGMARWGCVEVWNTRWASAHFGVAGDGTLVQFIPTTFVAFAQYSPGNEHWISVEVDNDGRSPMKNAQLATVQRLFDWVSATFGVPRRLATGCLFPKSSHFDAATQEVCARGGAKTTTDAYVACMSYGLSCHWWLEGNKNDNSHGCPGPGILHQLDRVARG